MHKDVKREVRKELTKHAHKPQRAISKARPKSQGPRVTTRVVGTGVEAPKWTGRVPHRKLSGDGRTCEYRSMDYVGTISIPSTAQVGDVLFSLSLSPLLVPATRLQKEAGQWERYRPRAWEFLLSSMHGTQFDGQVIAFVDPDPADVWSNTPLNINKAAAQFNSQPDNVWKNFETRLPIVPGVPDFYTNPTTSSDVRFTQAGVLRVVYTGGCVFPQGVTSHQLFNVYQWVDLMFAQPELDVVSGSSSSVGRVSTTQSTRANLLNGAKVSSAIPVTLTPNGAQIDTGNLGGSNLVVELIAEAQNLSNAASSFGVDLGIQETLDQVQQAVRIGAAPVGSAQGPLVEAVSQYLLDGTRSWELFPMANGIPSVNLPNTVMNLYTVPSTVFSVSQAQRLTKMRKISAPPPTSEAGAALICRASDMITSKGPCFAWITAEDRTGDHHYDNLGFEPLFGTRSVIVGGVEKPALILNFRPPFIGCIVNIIQTIGYKASTSNDRSLHDFVTNTSVYTDEMQGFTYNFSISSSPTAANTAWGQTLQTQWTATTTGPATLVLPDLVSGAATGGWDATLHASVIPPDGLSSTIKERSFSESDDESEFCYLSSSSSAQKRA